MDTTAVGILGAALLLAGGGVLGFLAHRTRRRAGIERLRRVLVEGTEDRDDPSLAATWSALVRSAEQKGAGSTLHKALSDRLTRAGWVLRPTELLLLLAGLAVGGGFLGWTLLGGVPAAAALAVGAPATAALQLTTKANRYANRCDEQLPDALTQLGTAMRSGHSLLQAIEGLATHGPQPLAGEMARVLADTRVGTPVDDAMVAMAERVGSTDLRWTVRAMVIHRRTGGRLADILEVLAEFMRDRREVRREVTALTAEGRISAIILMALPFVVLGGITVTNPDYLLPLVEHPLGRAMILAALGSMVLAWFGIRNIIKVEV